MIETTYEWRAYRAFDTFGQGPIVCQGVGATVPAVGDVIEVTLSRQLETRRYRVLTRTWERRGFDQARLTVEDLEP